MAKLSKADWTKTVTKLISEVNDVIDKVSLGDVKTLYRDVYTPMKDVSTGETLALKHAEVLKAQDEYLMRLRDYRDTIKPLENNKFYGEGKTKSLLSAKTMKLMGVKNDNELKKKFSDASNALDAAESAANAVWGYVQKNDQANGYTGDDLQIVSSIPATLHRMNLLLIRWYQKQAKE